MQAMLAENIELWARFYPREAVLLSYADDENLRWCHTERGEDNLCCQEEGQMVYYHSQKGAFEEATAWFEALNMANIELLYVYGVGLGYYYEAALSWLEKASKHTLVFFEDDKAVLHRLFSTRRANAMLKNQQVRIIYLANSNDRQAPFGELNWDLVFAEAHLSALEFYSKTKTKVYATLQQEIPFGTAIKRELLSEYLNYGAPYFNNCYQNLLYLHRSYLGNALFGKFKKVPAVICGAGPSLEKNRYLLKDLEQRALIFSGGSATNALNSIGVQPHFCVGIDPNSAQQQRLKSNLAFEVPFFYRSRLNHEAFKTVHAPCLYLTGSGGYEVTDFFEERFHIEGESLEEGHNVITFALEIAHKMGCDPIFLVGMDLAFTDKKIYSKGVLEDVSLEGQAQTLRADIIKKQDIYGNEVETVWKWVAESEWIGRWAKENSSISLINCTEGGIGMPHVPNNTLLKAAKMYLKRQWDLKSWVHAELQECRLERVTKEELLLALQDLKLSLMRSLEDFIILKAEGESYKLKLESLKPSIPFPHQQSGRAALAEIELGSEVAYTYILETFNFVYSQLLNRELLSIKYGKEDLQAWQRAIAFTAINAKKLTFLCDVAKVNIELINYALEQGQEKSFAKAPESESYPSFTRLLPEKEKLFLEDEIKEGLVKSFYPNGQLKGESYYKEGKLHGKVRYYSKEGSLLSESHYVEGLIEGLVAWYYPSGCIYCRQQFSQGLQEGLQEYFYNSGILKTRLYYNKGYLDQSISLYDAEGALLRQIKFTNNPIV